MTSSASPTSPTRWSTTTRWAAPGLGARPDGNVRLSETTLRLRDEERRELIDEARRAARKMILAHRAQLDALAAELLSQGGDRPRRRSTA